MKVKLIRLGKEHQVLSILSHKRMPCGVLKEVCIKTYLKQTKFMQEYIFDVKILPVATNYQISPLLHVLMVDL